jgi:hypothetical protein
MLASAGGMGGLSNAPAGSVSSPFVATELVEAMKLTILFCRIICN